MFQTRLEGIKRGLMVSFCIYIFTVVLATTVHGILTEATRFDFLVLVPLVVVSLIYALTYFFRTIRT
jgi:hypothetical protein